MRQSRPVVAMLTDFGDRDGFVGVMRGVILAICPEAILVDVAHHVPPQDVWHGAWVLGQATRVYPQGSIFLAVVDPAVGDQAQRRLALHHPDRGLTLLLPDNGLATRVLADGDGDWLAVSLQTPRWFRSQGLEVSATFHGRDIYAPVAAHLAQATLDDTWPEVWESLGPSVPLENLKKLALTPPQQVSEAEVLGQLDAVDHYGNLITNIPNVWLAPAEGQLYHLMLNQHSLLLPWVTHYNQAKSVTGGHSTPLALVPGSHGGVEVVYPLGNASQWLDTVRAGDNLCLKGPMQPPSPPVLDVN